MARSERRYPHAGVLGRRLRRVSFATRLGVTRRDGVARRRPRGESWRLGRTARRAWRSPAGRRAGNGPRRPGPASLVISSRRRPIRGPVLAGPAARRPAWRWVGSLARLRPRSRRVGPGRPGRAGRSRRTGVAGSTDVPWSMDVPWRSGRAGGGVRGRRVQHLRTVRPRGLRSMLVTTRAVPVRTAGLAAPGKSEGQQGHHPEREACGADDRAQPLGMVAQPAI